VPVEESITLTPEMLETAFIEPIDLYLRHTLDMFTYRKNEKETPATLPLDMDKDKKEFARLAQELLLLRAQHPNQETLAAWAAEVLRSGNLPPKTFGEKVIKELHILTTEMQKNLEAKSIDVSALAAVPVDLHVAEGIKLVGTIPMCTQGPEMITVVLLYGRYKKEYEWNLADSRIAIRLLIAKAVGLPVKKGYVLARHEEWPKKQGYVVRELSVEMNVEKVEAIRRLNILCEMARTALVSPCASFGETAKAINEKMTNEVILKMTKQFDAFVSKEDFHDKDEFIIFGNDIEFEDVFYMNSPIISFWQKRNTLFTLPKKPDIDEPKVHVIS
jgi:hypothetical protein